MPSTADVQKRLESLLGAALITGLLGTGATTMAAAPEPKKIHEYCHEMICEAGLECLERRDGTKRCGTCKQDTLATLTQAVDDACKAFRGGWTPAGSRDYQEVLASDGRVAVEVYDRMLELAKRCVEARSTINDTCWKGGDEEHTKELGNVRDNSIDRIATHKSKMIADRQVYYGNKSTYESRLSNFLARCKSDLNYPDLNLKLDVMKATVEKGEKIDCAAVEKTSYECDKCLVSARDLVDDGFARDSGKFPKEYSEHQMRAEETTKKAKDIYQFAKGKGLCN